MSRALHGLAMCIACLMTIAEGNIAFSQAFLSPSSSGDLFHRNPHRSRWPSNLQVPKAHDQQLGGVPLVHLPREEDVVALLEARPELIRWSQVLMSSFVKVVGRELIDRRGDDRQQAVSLFLAPHVVVSHGTEEDPVLNYGNRVALNLWDLPFAQFTQTPSRLTAEPMVQEDRAKALKSVAERGYVSDYSGIRISSTGKRFRIIDTIIWEVKDHEGRRVGQAATFPRWEWQ